MHYILHDHIQKFNNILKRFGEKQIRVYTFPRHINRCEIVRLSNSKRVKSIRKYKIRT